MVAQRQTTTRHETPNLRPIGRPGLVHSQGYIHEERVKELQGRLLADAVREMLDVDAKVGAERRAIDSLIKGVQWSIVAKDESEAAKDARTFVEEAFNDFDRPFTEILDDALTHLYYGWAVLEVVYKHRDGDHPDRTRRSKYEDGKLGWRDWSIRAQDTRLHWEIDDEAGEATALVQTPAPDYKPITVPLERCLHFRTTSHKGNPEGRSVLRNAIQPWYYRKHLQTIEAIGVERDLAGLPVLKVPSRIMSASATTDEKTLYEQAKKIVTGIRRDEQEGVVMPSDVDPASGKPLFELTLLSSAGQRQFDVDKVIARYSLEILQTMLADFIQLGHDKVGSFALSSDKTSLFAVALGAVLDHLAAVINDVAIPRLLRVNAVPTKVWPTFQWGDIEARDVAQTVDALLKLTQAGMEIFPNPAITRHILEMLDLPAPSLEELEAQAEEQQAQAAAMQQATLDGQKAKAEAIRQGKPTGDEKPPGGGPAGEDRAAPTPNEPPKRTTERAPFDLTSRPDSVPESMYLLADGSPDGLVDDAYVVYAAVDLADLERVLDEGLAPAVRSSDADGATAVAPTTPSWHRVATRRDEAVRLAEDEAPSAPVVLEYRLPFEAAERLLRRGYAAPDGVVLHALAAPLPPEYLAGEVRAFASKHWANQPRAPKGSPEGGEWTDGGGGSGASQRDYADLGARPPKGFDDHYRQWAGSLSASERQAVIDYTGGDFFNVNQMLRGQRKPEPRERTWVNRAVKNVDAAVARSSLPVDATLWRAATIDVAGLRAGVTIQDRAFVSTSTSRRVAEQFDKPGMVTLQIRAPRGSRGAYVDSLSRFGDEQEVLLPRGSRFRVVEVVPARGRTRPVIVVDLIGGE